MSLEIFALVVVLTVGVTFYEISSHSIGVVAVASLVAKVGLINLLFLKGVDVWIAVALACVPLARIVRFFQNKLDKYEK